MFLQRISPEKKRILYEIKKVGAHPYAFKMWEKGVAVNIKLKSIHFAEANIIKQEAIASGIDAAVAKGTVSGENRYTDVLITGDYNGLVKLIERLKIQPFNLSSLASSLEDFIKQNKRNEITARDKIINLEKPLIVGIFNATPDSFSDGGEFLEESVLNNRIQYLGKYSDIIDIGGESTRPGAPEIDYIEEINRIKIPLKKAVKLENVAISVDTTKSKVADFALRNGAHIINDISGFTFDKELIRVCADYNAGVCIMHTLDRPENMQKNVKYNNLLEDIKMFLYNAIEVALNNGIKKSSIVIDPGIGFGKETIHNYLILKYLEEFRSLGFPILIGLSRKSLIGNIDGSRVSERDLASKVLEAISIVNGADIVRTHDVESLRKIICMIDYYNKAEMDG
jgi:dihydropteroate synthase